MAAGGLLFAAFVPVTSLVAKEGGLFQSTLSSILQAVPGLGNIQADRIIPAMSAFYIFTTFGATGAASGAGVAAAHEKGLDMYCEPLIRLCMDTYMNANASVRPDPRTQVNNLKGLPYRLRSAHYNMMEMFPGFALAAALTQALAPTNQLLINLLGMHVLAKTAVYWPVYIMNLSIPRSLAHLFATSAVINVAWQLACGAQ